MHVKQMPGENCLFLRQRSSPQWSKQVLPSKRGGFSRSRPLPPLLVDPSSEGFSRIEGGGARGTIALANAANTASRINELQQLNPI
jgi:hypothetical protein